jgi:autotransporter-associated beta strand protein
VTAANGTTVNLANAASVFLNGTVAVSGAAANVVLSSGNISAGFSSAFTGAADQTLTITGANQVNIASNFQQFSGMNGTVAVASGATLRFSGSSLNNGGGNTTFALTGNLVTRNNGSLALGALSGNGNISMGGAGPNGAQLQLTIGAKGLAATYAGAISDADALNGKIVNVTKTGAGTQTFSGISTYTGATLVSAGTLLITGELSDSAVTVDGGTFGGTGTIASSLDIVSGSLQVADLANSLSVGGTVTLYSGFGVDDLAGLVWGDVTNDTYTLIDGTLADGIFAQLNHNSFATAYDIGGGRKAYFQEGSLQLVVIPEPGAALLGSLGLLALLRRRRA